MARQRITISDDGATLVISPEFVRALGLKNGDEIDVAVMDRSVVLRPLDEIERAQKLDAVTQAVLQHRKRALEQLTDDTAT